MTTQPRHHFDDDHLLDFTAGTAPADVVLPVALHLALCALCEQRIFDLETIATSILSSAPRPAPSAPLRQQILSSLGAQLPARPTSDQRLTAAGLPQVLRHYLPDNSTLDWRFVMPGLRTVNLRLDTPGTTARLVRFRPGFVVPRHDHGDREYTVVLRGSFVDTGQVYTAGDACVRHPGDQHELRISKDEECVAVVVNRAAFVPLTLGGRILNFIDRVIGWAQGARD